ncbi:hypothetical protein KBA73_04320 [Patescibacteria group bacterium]|nr:hypothetical protein [Patescibacteria group bacterium]
MDSRTSTVTRTSTSTKVAIGLALGAAAAFGFISMGDIMQNGQNGAGGIDDPNSLAYCRNKCIVASDQCMGRGMPGEICSESLMRCLDICDSEFGIIPGYLPPGYQPEGYFPPGYFPPGYEPEGYFPPGYVPPTDIFPMGYVPVGYVLPGYMLDDMMVPGYMEATMKFDTDTKMDVKEDPEPVPPAKITEDTPARNPEAMNEKKEPESAMYVTSSAEYVPENKEQPVYNNTEMPSYNPYDKKDGSAADSYVPSEPVAQEEPAPVPEKHWYDWFVK